MDVDDFKSNEGWTRIVEGRVRRKNLEELFQILSSRPSSQKDPF